MNVKFFRKKMLIVSLILFVLLSSCLFVCVVVPSVEGQSVIEVGTESELRNAVNNAVAYVPVVIALSRDIEIKGSIYVVDNRNITLTSIHGESFRLVTADDSFVIAIMNGGAVKLDGIVVSHVKDSRGGGVYVDRRSVLHLASGKISGNYYDGVNIGGVFVMSGGEISDNDGKGVSSNDDRGSIVMSGGVISGNKDCGVYTTGTFELSNGEIVRNNNQGVYNLGTFKMSGGKISDNAAISKDSSYVGDGYGGGVDNRGIFEMHGGEISGNKASWSGGGVNNFRGVFVMSGGEISRNIVINGVGGGVNNYDSKFSMSGGVISGNSAVHGGGVYNGGHENKVTCELLGGTISGNVASDSGGGIWVAVENLDKLFVSDGVVFSNNRASASYDRNPIHDEVYNSHIGSKVTWTSPFTQGYNNYDISYINDTPSSPEPSNPVYSPNPTGSPSGSAPNEETFDLDSYTIFIVAALVLLVVIVMSIILLRKRRG